jgi:hypothetical protein
VPNTPLCIPNGGRSSNKLVGVIVQHRPTTSGVPRSIASRFPTTRSSIGPPCWYMTRMDSTVDTVNAPYQVQYKYSLFPLWPDQDGSSRLVANSVLFFFSFSPLKILNMY